MLNNDTNLKKLTSFVLGVTFTLGSAVVANADTMTFNFNTLADGASNSSIQTYMQGVVTANSGGNVTVAGAVAEQNYNGDNHVVGNHFYNGAISTNTNKPVYSNTLGTSDGATAALIGQRTPGQGYYDTFIVNNNIGSTPHSDKITITFTLPVGATITSVSFDLEIFPNASCTSASHCNPVPDFTFKTDGSTKYSINAALPTSGLTNDSPLSNSETAYQYLGISGLIDINDINNLTMFEFIDWPAEIGIDNFIVNYNPPGGGGGGDGPLPGPQNQVPEPSSLMLLGFGVIGLRSMISRRTK